MSKLRIGLDPTGRLVAVDFRQLNVNEDEIGAALGCDRHPVFPVDRLDHLEAGIGKQIVEDTPIVLAVVNDEDAFAHAADLCSVTRTGTTMLNVLPTPTQDCTSMWPP